MSAADRLLSGRRLIRSLPGLFHEQVYLYSVLGIQQIRYAGVFSFGPGNCIWEPWMGPGETGKPRTISTVVSQLLFSAYVLAESLIGASLACIFIANSWLSSSLPFTSSSFLPPLHLIVLLA